MSISLPIDLQKDRTGSGKYKPLKRNVNATEENFFTVDEDLKKILDDMDRASIRTTFKQASDPVYLAFKHIDNKPLSTLTREFVQDGASDFIELISKIFA